MLEGMTGFAIGGFVIAFLGLLAKLYLRRTGKTQRN